MSSHAGRSHLPNIKSPRTFEEALKSRSQRSNSDGRFRLKSWTPSFPPAPGLRWQNPPEKATPKTAIHHNIGDAEFGSPETRQWTGRIPALSGADVTHRRTSAAFIHADCNVETREHDSFGTTNPSKTCSRRRRRVNTCTGLMENNEIAEYERLG